MSLTGILATKARCYSRKKEGPEAIKQAQSELILLRVKPDTYNIRTYSRNIKGYIKFSELNLLLN